MPLNVNRERLVALAPLARSIIFVEGLSVGIGSDCITSLVAV